MGRDEHNKSRGRNRLAQTPKNQKSDGRDIEFSEELADHDDKIAQERSKAADKRVKNYSRK
ncbi:YfhD family protein [Virgibacillus siamensis]|uniref:YfhD family protein n=1 Tax=Virgibacillus siamensis TaxID=480071 RepID=A0ABN1G516_9BACI